MCTVILDKVFFNSMKIMLQAEGLQARRLNFHHECVIILGRTKLIFLGLEKCTFIETRVTPGHPRDLYHNSCLALALAVGGLGTLQE